jgi:drug/metabolite transporter (DMT)-like permease
VPDDVRDSTSLSVVVAELVLRALLLIALVVLNSVMLTGLVDALAQLGTVRATATINALSFVLSGVLGWALFGEHIRLQWWLGVALIGFGVALLQADEPTKSARRPELMINRAKKE